MAGDSLTNFASTTLAIAMQTGDTTFTVASGQGAAFPTENFLVSIDTEILLVSSRVGSVFTVASGGRGYDGTLVGTHAIGALVQLAVTAYHLNHLWQNTKDSFDPDVPPTQSTLATNGTVTGTAGQYDTEFESQGNWTLYPTNGGSLFDINTTYRSHLFFNRVGNDTSLYTAYTAFNVSSAYLLTCKISDAVDVPHNGSQGTQATFFITDQTNPVSSHDSGNRIRIDVVTSCSVDSTYNAVWNQRSVRLSKNVNGTWTQVSPYVVVSMAMPLYLSIHYNGGGSWRGYVGDGYTYSMLGAVTNFPFSTNSMGFQFYAGNMSGNYTQHMALVDFCRFAVDGNTIAGTGFPLAL